MEINDGGPAFPRSAYGPQGDWDSAEGMTLRQWYAGMALQGLLVNQMVFRERYDGQTPWREAISKEALSLADAMIALESPEKNPGAGERRSDEI